MRRAALQTVLCCFFAVSFCLPQVSFGADNVTEANSWRKRADAAFDKAIAVDKATAFNNNKKGYQEAHDAYAEAFRLDPNAGTLAMVASCLKELQRLDDALYTYDRVLREFPQAEASFLKQVQHEIKSLHAGTIEITGDVPNGARLFIDSRDVGTLPLAGPVYARVGNHEIRVKKDGFPDLKTTVDVHPGQLSEAKLVAKPRVGKLMVREKHNWPLRVYVDGKDTQRNTPILDGMVVDEGEHRIQLRGLVSKQAVLECEPSETLAETGARAESLEQLVVVRFYETTDVPPLAAQELDASLKITSTPHAFLTIDGKDKGLTPWGDWLPLGEHSIELRAEGFLPTKQKVKLERRGQPDLRIALARIPEPPVFWTPQRLRIGTITGFSVGGVGLAFAGVTFGMALTLNDSIEPILQDTAERLANVSTAGVVIGGLGAAVGTTFLLVDLSSVKKPGPPRPGVSLSVGPAGVLVGGQF